MVAEIKVDESGIVKTGYLFYDGARREGSIQISCMKASSPFRIFHYRQGGRYEIGKEVNEKAAEWLAKYQRTIFHIEVEEVGGEKAFVVAFSNLLALYKPVLEMEELGDFLPLIEKGFEKEGSKIKVKRVIPRGKDKKKDKDKESDG